MPIDMKLLSTKVEDEVRIMAMVRDHPNVIQLEYGFRLGHSVFMCMELFYGHDLLTEIHATGDGSGLGEEKARYYFRQLMEGVQYCRTQNIVHGDIKLENILVNKRGQLKLIDFGFAHVFIEGRNLEVLCSAFRYSHVVAYVFFPDSWRNSDIFSS
jgi:serine/threonine protein kinase